MTSFSPLNSDTAKETRSLQACNFVSFIEIETHRKIERARETEGEKERGWRERERDCL